MMKRITATLVFVLIGLSSLSVYAEDFASSIVFSQKELDAAFTLTRPELNKIDLYGRTGTLDPAPAFKFLGIGQVQFEINLNFIANLVDIQFKHMRSKAFQVQFQDQGLLLTIPLEDQAKAIYSTLGSINFKNVTIMAVVGTKNQSNGDQWFTIKNVTLNGDLSGTGLLKSKLIMNKTRQMMVNMVTKELNKMLSNQNIQDKIKNGLVTWSNFYTGEDYHSVVPGSLTVNAGGISYQAQH